jgi:hypothetical protein
MHDFTYIKFQKIQTIVTESESVVTYGLGGQ